MMTLDPTIESGTVWLKRSSDATGRVTRDGGGLRGHDVLEGAIWRLVDTPRVFPDLVQALATMGLPGSRDVSIEAGEILGSLIDRGLVEAVANADD